MLTLLLLGYALYLALLFLQQRSMMFPGSSMRWEGSRWPLPADSERVVIDASFGRLRGILLHAAAGTPPYPAALFFKGNAEFAEQNVDLLAPLAGMGMHVLIIEYPGYAGGDGEPSRQSLNEAARRGFDWLASRADVDRDRTFAIGRSIGTGAAVDLAAERPLAALLLLAPFTSIGEFAWRVGAPPFLVRDRFDNLGGVAAFDAPLLVVHGRGDRIIPFPHGQRVAEAAPQGRLLALDCDHNDCPFFSPSTLARMRAFLEEAAVLP